MKLINFKEQNFTLTRPFTMTDEECGPLKVHRSSGRIISCWKMNLMDKIKAVLFGKVWVDVVADVTHPPIAILCCRTVFWDLQKMKKAKAKGKRGKLFRD